MIRYFFGSDMNRHTALAAAMFRDRTAQFRDRMGWDVTVDVLGWETDGYDALDPLYVVALNGQGGHAGSMRFLPTSGPTMLADVFPHLMQGRPVRARNTWECTRFCLAPGAAANTARHLLRGASELGLGLGLTHALGVFDRPMMRVYRRLGWAPELLGQAEGIAAGRWTFSPETHDMLCAATGVTARASRDDFDQDLGHLDLPRPLSVRA